MILCSFNGNCLVLSRVDDLWERLANCYDAILKTEEGNVSFDALKTLLWLALSLEDVDEDDEVKDIAILSFGKPLWCRFGRRRMTNDLFLDDLKNLIINYYDFALRENANSLSQEAVQLQAANSAR